MRPINRCLNKQLLNLCQQSAQLDELNSLLCKFLKPSLAAHCSVASFNQGCLIINVDDATWATELKYGLFDLRDRLRKEAGLYKLVSINIKIHNGKNDIPQTRKEEKSLSLSDSARHSIRVASESCDYPPLKAALHRLAEPALD